MQLGQSPGPETRLEDTCSQPGSPRRSAGVPARPFPLCPPGPLGDCDPAKIAYTGKIPAMALEAVEDWVKVCCGADWYECNLDLGYGTPFVHLSCDFQSPITPLYELLFQLVVESLGEQFGGDAIGGRSGWQDLPSRPLRLYHWRGRILCSDSDSAGNPASHGRLCGSPGLSLGKQGPDVIGLQVYSAAARRLFRGGIDSAPRDQLEWRHIAEALERSGGVLNAKARRG